MRAEEFGAWPRYSGGSGRGGEGGEAASALCIKPAADGCSTGVARLASAADLAVYARALAQCRPALLPNTLSSPHPRIELPVSGRRRFAFLRAVGLCGLPAGWLRGGPGG